MKRKEYLQHVADTTPKSAWVKNMFWAFIIGGIICMVGQGISDLLRLGGVRDVSQIGSYTSMILVAIAALMTGFGVYDKIGSVAGAGSILPITGFSNSIVSPAMEFNREGVIFGVMSRMFVIAGPVIVSGVTFSVLIGLIYLIFGI